MTEESGPTFLDSNRFNELATGPSVFLKKYLESGGSPETCYNKMSLLGWAVWNDKKEHVKLLLTNKANPDLFSFFYPLDRAKNEEMVKLLVYHGAHHANFNGENRNELRDWKRNAKEQRKEEEERKKD
eukprot:TRINITY_DN20050_c0_g1_i1.p1 TRINITY_DN20050_c0_g1~~TRINITY_DN20050_c0_g1_i1.p1  ORF type:complete len:128 (+),score=35.42 TRINITY_DN20050_c0_g1_i1:103-486(+)